VLRVNGPAGKVKVRIRISAKRSSVTYVRTVPMNKLVKIRNLKTPKTKGALRPSVSIVS
jgi:hypothetical protein